MSSNIEQLLYYVHPSDFACAATLPLILEVHYLTIPPLAGHHKVKWSGVGSGEGMH